ncbi:UDP-2,3-diacylglucosamine diphosphatase LpxI [Methyloligella sp. 2.7D]|uniref:LpxI family protein n=1 Tax=unclassified Methyloligella TaxID=2625955 RepID=UPI00157C9828|nr:UDP-2,3-diacylglucosamine diphosphatase LpxI [Methyloligella sp. GL2]QKP77517.1 UDP-2,3-diacylglucosamine diphosphatase LpxI [Methyloligella sp. GL2]
MALRKTRTEDGAQAPDGDSPLAIIAGGGPLPCVLADITLGRGRPVHIIGLVGEADEAITRYPHSWMKWGEIGKLFSILEKNGCRDLVMIGKVTRPDVKNLSVDFGALKSLPFLITLGTGGDDKILSSIVNFFEEKGFRVLGVGQVAPELLAGEGILGKKTPSSDDREDIAVGFRVLETLGALDIGQAAVIVNAHVLAVEAAEGTDAMLSRCADLRKNRYRFRRKRLGVLVKAPKPGQEERIDLPTIGPRTIERAAEAGLSGIAIGAGRVLIVDREATIAAANKHGLFLIAEAPSDG